MGGEEGRRKGVVRQISDRICVYMRKKKEIGKRISDVWVVFVEEEGD